MKLYQWLFTCTIVFIPGCQLVDPEQDLDAETEWKFLIDKLNKETEVMTNKDVLAEWAYASNLTDYNKEFKLNVSLEIANFRKTNWLKILQAPWDSFHDPDLRRQFRKFSDVGFAALPEDKFKRIQEVMTLMESNYGEAKVCEFQNQTNCGLSLDPELTHILTTSDEPDEQKYYWLEWRKVAGKKARSWYEEYVKFSNEAARLNNYTDAAEYWLHDFEAPEFEQDLQKIWNQLEPLYMQLHAYVRRKLNEKYGDDIVPRTGAIPAHLLGNMWSQEWGKVYNSSLPFPGKQSVDVTPKMKEQNYTALKMFKLAEEFFTSLNLSEMPESFWNNSIIEKPKDRELICHASAWDFYDRKDFRIKMCTAINMDDLLTIHHEMGHIQYYLQYKDQPIIYRSGANSGFHEAVGDVLALSVCTPKHLRKIGLLDIQPEEDDYQADINYLYRTSLDKIAFLPFGYLIDLWRWGVFRGTTTPEDYNCQWWNLRWRYQGIEPPEHRSEEDFDPAAKYHTVANTPYIRYFVSFVIQFQFHKALCEKAGQFDPKNPTSKPLHHCDIYQSTEAGNALSKMLKMGSSKPWPDAMEALTGQRKMDAGALLEYFSPLMEWLKNENAKTGEEIGWLNRPLRKRCVKNLSELDNVEKATEEAVTEKVQKQ